MIESAHYWLCAVKWRDTRKASRLFTEKAMKDIEGYEGLYAVTEDGRVWSYPKTWARNVSHNGCWLIPRPLGRGYLSVGLNKEGKVKRFLIHRLVALAFIPNLKNFPQVNHKDGNRLNNQSDNLEWTNNRGNMEHAVSLGLFNRKGEKHPLAKFDEATIREIRRLWEQGGITQRVLAKEFNMSYMNVSLILRKKTWGHIV